ncbi:MAG: oligopeptide:H+ symporter [Endozoicomonas sp. (ex Botrylloides leachii)]|nr:oligopeptide:H+ symporter [Endozoicomonas sp. (ex Botrylloides leachii)]
MSNFFTGYSIRTKQELIKRQVTNVAAITFFSQFASYAINSIFILFLTLPMIKNGLGMTEAQAYEFMGVTQAVGYIMPFIGGYIIDKYLGLRRGITVGVSLLVVAYGLVYLGSSYVHIFGNKAFIAAYALIPAINSFVMAPSSALVSRIYKGDEVGSKSGMTLYYMSINIGSLIGIGVAPMLMNSQFGVMSVLAIVVIGKALSALNFIAKYKLYENIIDDMDTQPMTLGRLFPVLTFLSVGYLLSFIAYLNPSISTYLIGAGCVSGIFIFCVRTLLLKGADRTKQLVAAFLILVAVVFFVLYNQMATTMVLFIKNNTDFKLFGIKLAAAQFQMINPLVIILIGSALPRFYRAFKRFTIPYQFSVGVILAGLSMITLWAGAIDADHHGITSANYVGLAYFIITIAELFVSAVGLSMIGLFCHSSMITFAMGAWYLAASMSNLISGQLGKLVALPRIDVDPFNALHSYSSYFSEIGIVGVAAGLLLCIVMYFLQRSLNRRGIAIS